MMTTSLILPCTNYSGESSLILPGTPEYYQAINQLPPNWNAAAHEKGNLAFVADVDTGLLRNASNQEFAEYLFGGEYEERQKQIYDDYEDEFLYSPEELEGIEEFYVDF